MPLAILGLSGSLRRESLNTRLLHAAQALMPADTTLTVRTLHGIPLYDGDLEAQGVPAAVTELREAIREADGVLLSSPEYNNGVPGVFKNAIDWVSRGTDQPLAHKPVALMSASPGGMGGVRSQLAWLPTLATLRTRHMHEREFYLSAAHRAFTPDGALADDKSAEQLRTFLAAFGVWVRG
jgi:NAD(P)H-dependent FMN reductase